MNLSLLLQSLILNLEIEIAAPKNVPVLARHRLALLIAARTQLLTQFATEAARKPDQALRVLRQIFLAHARLAIEPMQACLARQPDQVAVALFVFRQHQQVVVLVVGRLGTMVLGLAHVELAPQNRLDALLFRRIEKVHSPIDIPVVGHRDRRLPQRRHPVHKLVNVASPIQQRVFRMQMQMRKFSHG